MQEQYCCKESGQETITGESADVKVVSQIINKNGNAIQNLRRIRFNKTLNNDLLI